MPSPEQMVAVVDAYVQAFASHDLEAVMRLYAPNATVEDPVGSPAYQGIEAIRAFYSGAIGSGATLALAGPVRTTPHAAAFAFSVHVVMEGVRHQIDVIDTFVFDASGKIVEMRAFWGPQNVRRL